MKYRFDAVNFILIVSFFASNIHAICLFLYRITPCTKLIGSKDFNKAVYAFGTILHSFEALGFKK